MLMVFINKQIDNEMTNTCSCSNCIQNFSTNTFLLNMYSCFPVDVDSTPFDLCFCIMNNDL